jgi:hypothetical protein
VVEHPDEIGKVLGLILTNGSALKSGFPTCKVEMIRLDIRADQGSAAEECDATKADSSNAAGQTIKNKYCKHN